MHLDEKVTTNKVRWLGEVSNPKTVSKTDCRASGNVAQSHPLVGVVEDRLLLSQSVTTVSYDISYRITSPSGGSFYCVSVDASTYTS